MEVVAVVVSYISAIMELTGNMELICLMLTRDVAGGCHTDVKSACSTSSLLPLLTFRQQVEEILWLFCHFQKKGNRNNRKRSHDSSSLF